MWLIRKQSKNVSWNTSLVFMSGKGALVSEITTYRCFSLLKLAKDGGIGPDIWFSSNCILSKLDSLLSSSGKDPINLLPLRSLKHEKANYRKNAKLQIYMTDEHETFPKQRWGLWSTLLFGLAVYMMCARRWITKGSISTHSSSKDSM